MTFGLQNGNLSATSASLGGSALSYVPATAWTPTISASGTQPTTLTYTSYGQYQRLGSVIFYQLSITLSAFTAGPGSGNITIGGFPVTAINAVHAGDAACASSNVNLSAATQQFVIHVVPNTTTALLQISTDNAASSFAAIGTLKSNSVIEGSGIYFVA